VRRLAPALLAFAIAIAALLAMRTASAVEHNIAGSAQLDYNFVPTAPGANANQGTNAAFDGFTLEAAVKLSVDVSEHLSGNVKVCVGCHGFEADMTYFDFRAFDELNVRAGRFSPSFGAFNLRHDPANQKLSDKPLPYDMGRMLRKSIWGNGVLPAPFPDNGVEIDGTHWFGDAAQLDYAAYAVMGFRNDSAEYPLDLNFAEAHPPNYFVDNNGRPTLGARAAITLKTGPFSDVTLGASGQYGTYDAHDELAYAIVGADLSLRVGRTNVRFEYLARRTEFSTEDPELLKYVVPSGRGDFFVKHGAFGELEIPVARDLDLAARADGMVRVGNVAAGSPLSSRSSVIRETLGAVYALERNFRLKASGEVYEFSDADPASGRTTEVSLHLGAVGTF
jgi:hypothetical protein